MRTTPFLLAAALIAGCTAAPSPSAAPTPSSAPTPSVVPSPTPTIAPSPSAPAAGVALDVFPPEDPPEVRTAIPGQGVCFLVVIADDGAVTAPVTITASATGATIRRIEPAELGAGTVGEVWVVPDPSDVETIARVTITGTRNGQTATVERSLPIFPMADERRSDAKPHADRWLAWLATAHPELGITADTAWTPEFVSTLLVVSHYAYWSPDWEMTVLWHNMIPPYDWTEVQLRHRWTEAAPSLAFHIDSVKEGSEPYAVAPPEVVVR